MGNIIIYMKNKYNYLFDFFNKKELDIIIKTTIYKNYNKSFYYNINENSVEPRCIINSLTNIYDINIYHLSILYDLIKQNNIDFYYHTDELNMQQNIYLYTIIINILQYVKKLNNYQKTIFFYNYIKISDDNIYINIENLCKHIIFNKNIIFSIEIYQFSIILYNILKNKFNDNYHIIKILDHFKTNNHYDFNLIIDNLIINLYNNIFYNYLVIYYTNYYTNVKFDYIDIENNIYQLECNKILYINNIKCNLCNNISYFNYTYNKLPNFCLNHKNNDMDFKNLNIINDNDLIKNMPLIKQVKLLENKKLNIVNLKDINDSNLCITCSSNYKNIINFPCGHIYSCSVCYLKTKHYICYMCNDNINNIFKVYL